MPTNLADIAAAQTAGDREKKRERAAVADRQGRSEKGQHRSRGVKSAPRMRTGKGPTRISPATPQPPESDSLKRPSDDQPGQAIRTPARWREPGTVTLPRVA